MPSSGKYFLDKTPKILSRDENKLTLWTKSSSKAFVGIVKRMKRLGKDWEKIFINQVSNKGHISVVYKEFTKFNKKKIRKTVFKLDKKFQQALHPRRYTNG